MHRDAEQTRTRHKRNGPLRWAAQRSCRLTRAVITGPLPSLTVTITRLDVAPVFAGGDPALHYDPIARADSSDLLAGTDATGPPRS